MRLRRVCVVFFSLKLALTDGKKQSGKAYNYLFSHRTMEGGTVSLTDGVLPLADKDASDMAIARGIILNRSAGQKTKQGGSILIFDDEDYLTNVCLTDIPERVDQLRSLEFAFLKVRCTPDELATKADAPPLGSPRVSYIVSTTRIGIGMEL
jgi:hypothetical protein